MGDYKISVEEAVALSGGELNKDDVYSLIQANEVPGCIYVKKNEEKERRLCASCGSRAALQ